VQLPTEEQACKLIEVCARVAYRSEPKGNPIDFVKRIGVQKGHLSIMEYVHPILLIKCSRGVANEIVRHRIASFSQESTRYCNYAKDKFESQITFIHPLWISDEQIELAKRMNERNLLIDLIQRIQFRQIWMNSHYLGIQKKVSPSLGMRLPNTL
jgi:thymidylate synthase ThyX